MTMTNLFFSVEVVLTRGMDWLNLNGTSMLDESSPSLLSSFISRAIMTGYLGKGEAVTKEACLLFWEGNFQHHPLFLDLNILK